MRRTLMVLLTGSVLAATGCEDFLTVTPKVVTREVFYTDHAHVEQAAIKVYAAVRDMFGPEFRLVGDLRGDLTTHQTSGRPILDDTYELEQYTEHSGHSVIDGLYRKVFRTIFDANVVLSRIDAVEWPEDEAAWKEQLRAEAKVGRALAYWVALQLWGLGESWQPTNLAVPLILDELTHPDQAFELQRATVQQVYDQIIKDLTEARPNLVDRVPPSGQVGRFTKGAATFLLGATYQLDPSATAQQQALAAFEELEAMGYTLITTGTAASGNNAYRHVFNPENKNNAESILELQYSQTIDTNLQFSPLRQNLNPDHSPLNAAGGGDVNTPTRVAIWGASGNGNYLPTPNLVLSFAGASAAGDATPVDLRYRGGYGQFCPGSGTSGVLNAADELAENASPNTAYPEVNIASVRDPITGEIRQNCIAYYTKWRWPGQSAGIGRDNNNWIVFRYADALLRRAEVLANLNRPDEALAVLNQVRARAGLDPLAGLSGNALKEAILQERAWELAGEGHRFMDLKRFGLASEIISGDYAADRAARLPSLPAGSYMRDGSTYRLRLPIRPEDVRLSGCRILQNPGWGGECAET